jgi:hypothetical protein
MIIISLIFAVFFGVVISCLIESFLDIEIPTFFIIIILWSMLPSSCSNSDEVDDKLMEAAVEIEVMVKDLKESDEVIELSKSIGEISDRVTERIENAKKRNIDNKNEVNTKDKVEVTQPKITPVEKSGNTEEDWQNDPYVYGK